MLATDRRARQALRVMQSLSVRSVARAGLALALLAVLACKDETATVDVPFDGPDVPTTKKKSTLDDMATATPTSSAVASGTATAGESPAGTMGNASSGGISPCCAALRANSRTAKDDAARANLLAAANACETQRLQLDQGKVTRAQALTAVRLSLLDSAPPACR